VTRISSIKHCLRLAGNPIGRDLVDRGPDSLETLALVEEPWLHAVLANHDLMLLNYLGYYSSRIHSRASLLSGAGEWIKHAQARHAKQLRRLEDRLARLPLGIHVEARIPFNVMHGDLAPIRSGQAGR
jgi:serine/threonine protein phosphatase 1